MIKGRAIAGIAVGAMIAAAAIGAPAAGALERRSSARGPDAPAQRLTGTFTPAAADPRLAAVFARGGLGANEFRFTPAESRRDKRAVTVAVRARSTQNALAVADSRVRSPDTISTPSNIAHRRSLGLIAKKNSSILLGCTSR